MKKCPNCGGNRFVVAPHVVQEWIVDENGIFMRELHSCIEVTHMSDDDDIWGCYTCGHDGPGSEFNVKER